MKKRTEYDISKLEDRRDWVFSSWIYWAGYGYEQYKLFGRGVVIFDGKADSLKYALKTDNPYTNDLIRAYDPETGIVVLFIAGALVASGVYIKDDMPPPQAFLACDKERKRNIH